MFNIRPNKETISEMKTYLEPKMKLQFKKFLPNAQAPLRATEGAAGYDLFAATEEVKMELTGPIVTYSTGIGVKIPNGYVGLIAPRSSIATKTTLALANSVGVIDSDFSGVITFKFRNLNIGSGKKYKVGDRIGQLLVVPVEEVEFEEVEELPETVRGSGGYGSTGD